MEQYHTLILNALDGNYKQNRTDADTISTFSEYYEIDISSSFPLLTSKKMDTYRWNSMIHELVWYLSGKHHIKELRERTGIWNEWADDEWNLPSAYGRFWRRFPVPEAGAQLPGEVWSDERCPWVTRDAETGKLVFDQIQYVLDALQGNHPEKGPHSRRLVVNAWHPANAAESTLPPCHYTFALNVQDGALNCHLTQRSADIALGVPFNIAAYALLAKVIAKQTGFDSGIFSHTLVDAHVYCGKNERGEWYNQNIDELQERLSEVERREDYRSVRDWVLEETPSETSGEVDPASDEYGYDHVPGLLEQLAREPLSQPTIQIESDSVDELAYDDVELQDYTSHGSLGFEVAE